MSEKKLFLLDGHALVYRAHFAFITRPLINSKGMNTSAITGFVRTLWDIIRNEKPTHLAVAFDPKGGTFRHDYFPEYKAGRDATPEDITNAFPWIHKIVEGFDIPIVSIPSYEADDAIGTLAKQAEKEGFKVYMVTPDKDYAQLVSENIFMYKPSRAGNGVDILGVPEVLEKWGIQRVDQVIDVLGLQGDSVDNIPGIPGIGPKTATKLLAQFDSMEGILENADQLKGKMKEKVIEFADQGRMSKRLATIKLDVPCQFDADKYIISKMNKPVLAEIFKELEFRTLATQILDGGAQANKQGSLFGGGGNDVPTGDSNEKRGVKAHSVAEKNIHDTEHDYQLIDNVADQLALAKSLENCKSFCFDTETTDVDANLAELVGLAFSTEKGKAQYVPVPEEPEAAMAVVHQFKKALEDPNIIKIGQNLKYDMLVMKWYDIEVAGQIEDTMLHHYLLEPDLRHNLNYLAESYLKYQMVSIETLIGKKGKNQLTMRSVEVEKAKEYAGEDADITLQLFNELRPQLKEEVETLYNDIEAPLVKVLVDLEHAGVRVDGEFLAEYSKELETSIREKELEIYEKAGGEFKISSPKQVGEILFGRMEIPYKGRKTSTGQYSTNEAKLLELAKDHPIVNDILKFRGFSKLKSTYVDALPRMINPKSGRIHSSFNQALAATGRLSSNNPNLQNIPIKTPEGRRVREAFKPRDKDHILLAADYSQIELRLIAEISKDEAMLDAFIKGLDIHTATASKVYEVDIDKVTPEQRRNAKTVNFSITYGAGATNLSNQLDISRKEAQELIKAYFTQYNGLKVYMEKVVEDAQANGYTTTLLGRRRYLRDINSKNGFIRSNAERLAINSPIQGSAADMIKVAMINIHKAFKEQNIQSQMILQVHDELVFDVYKPELEKVKGIVEELMRTAIPGLKVPILISMDTGNNWLEAH